MPFVTTIDKETGTRTHVVTGEVTLEDLLAVLGQVYQSSDYRPEAPSLWDLRWTGLHTFSKSEIRQIVEFVSRNWNAPPGTRAALVVARSLDYGLARMYEQMLAASSGVKVMVFRDIAEAGDWLRAGGED
jgi:hypothetical protein